MNVTLYEIDAIRSLEHELSRNLPSQPQQSKPIALQRLQNLDAQAQSRLRTAAQGLAKAMHYGVDRFPAIVFEGKAVVYGLTDTGAALRHYQAWRAGERP